MATTRLERLEGVSEQEVLQMSLHVNNRRGNSIGGNVSTRLARLRAVVVAVVAGVAPLVATGSPAGATTAPWTHKTFNCELRSHVSGQWVTAELAEVGGLTGMLRARSKAIFSWNSFECDAVGSTSWAIRSRVNEQYVTPEFWYPGVFDAMLRARAASVGPREQYAFVPVASCSCYAIRAANGRYVSAELADPGLLTGMLRARATVIGPWEEFDIRQGGPPRPTVTGIDDGLGAGNVVVPGIQVTISGTGFATTSGATTFEFGTANPATDVTCSSTTQCVATVPQAAGHANPVDVIATVAGLASLPNPPYDQANYFGGIGHCCPF
jgi:hypothetical protein